MNKEIIGMKQITAKEVETLIRQGETLNIIDVREVEEAATGKIPGAVNIPLRLLEFRMHELDKSKECIVVCRSGGRSARAVQFLQSYGYNVINMTGGMLEWKGPLE
jgi:rhodanese-related sulfurtransferase